VYIAIFYDKNQHVNCYFRPKITVVSSRIKVKYTIELESDDSVQGIGQGKKLIELLHNTFCFDFPFEITEPHPDLIALSALTVVLPWIGSSITFPHPVSSKFATSLQKEFACNVVNVNKMLQPRSKGNTHVLSFSGGIDSFAASLVLPKDTVKITFIRKVHEKIEERHSHYATDAMLRIIESVDKAYPVYSDLEHIIGPFPQYPTWVTLSSPSLLLADHFDVQSISYGTIMGSAYIPAGREFKKIVVPDSHWRRLFADVGIDLTKPVAGLTEIGTSIIVNNSAFKEIASSCQYGGFQSPCMNCLKCLRKYFVGLAINKHKPSKDILNNFWRQKGVRDYMAGEGPLYFQHILMYAFSRMDRSDLTYPFRLLYDKLMMGNNPIEWCHKEYTEAMNVYIPDQTLRSSVKNKINQYINEMSRDDIEIVEQWNLYSYYNKYRNKIADIDKCLDIIWKNNLLENYNFNLLNKYKEIEKFIALEKNNVKVLYGNIEILQKEVDSLRESIRYKAGDIIVRSLSSPSEFIKLPMYLYKLYRERRKVGSSAKSVGSRQGR